MGVRNENNYSITIAVALIDKYVSSLEDYIDKINVIKEIVNKEVVSKHNEEVEIFINTADNYDDESIYLTVTGTSAEHGDDGQVGRGNRVNGLITPYRPMSLEAAAGKNAISHVGKIYNFFANDLAKEIVDRGYGEEAYVYVVSQIGKPITEPQSLDIKIKSLDKSKEGSINKLAEEMLNEMPSIWKKVLEGKYKVAWYEFFCGIAWFGWKDTIILFLGIIRENIISKILFKDLYLIYTYKYKIKFLDVSHLWSFS